MFLKLTEIFSLRSVDFEYFNLDFGGEINAAWCEWYNYYTSFIQIYILTIIYTNLYYNDQH